jgi:ketosteroid isomerase-like protein
MNDADQLIRADAARREAMISGDAGALAAVLSDDLIWTHSSGRTDDKTAVLSAIESKSVRYESLEVERTVIKQHGEIFLYHGTLNGRVVKDGEERQLRNKFLSVWRRAGATLQMLAWQSTGF